MYYAMEIIYNKTKNCTDGRWLNYWAKNITTIKPNLLIAFALLPTRQTL